MKLPLHTLFLVLGLLEHRSPQEDGSPAEEATGAPRPGSCTLTPPAFSHLQEPHSALSLGDLAGLSLAASVEKYFLNYRGMG